MASQTRSPSRSSNDTSVGTTAWVSSGGIVSSNDVHANCPLTTLDEVSNGLRGFSYAFSVPASAKIDGVVVEVERSVVIDGCKDVSARLVKGGTVSGDEKAASVAFPATDAYITYGSATDLWGLTLAASDVNAANFGFQFQAQNTSGDPLVSALVDHIQITVYYTPTGAPSMMLVGVGM